MRLFVYGTLHPDRAPAQIADVVQHFQFVGKATILGELLQLPGYPAVRLRTLLATEVPGTVFEFEDNPELLRRLDHYEDFRPEDPAASLFVRCQVPVRFDDGRNLLCWVYAYNQL